MSSSAVVQEATAHDRLPPRVPGLPVLGNTHQLLKNPGGFFPDAYRRYGPSFRVKVAGTHYVVLAGREAFEFFMQLGERYFTRAEFYNRFGRELGTNRFILGEPPDGLRDLRRKMRLGLSRQAASAYVPEMINAVDRNLDAAYEGETVRAMEFLGGVSLEQYGYLLCGRSVRDILPDARRFTRFIMNVGTKLWPEMTLQYPPYKRARRKVFRYVHGLLDEARQPGTDRFTLLDALLAARTDGDEPVPDAEIVSCALYGFVGTLVYMDRAASFLLYHVLADPELKRGLTEEADAVFADGEPDVRDLRRLTRLRAAFREAMRYHPIALGLPFLAAEDFEFHGYRIRRGEYVVLSAVPGHFSDQFYTCPHRFDPQRFQPPRNEHRNRGAYAPFGLASRFCPASGLVEMMSLITVGRMLNRRELAMDPPGETLKETLNPLPGPTRRFGVKLLERRKAMISSERPGVEDEAPASALPMGGSDELESALSRAEARTYQPGEVIVREGERAERFYVISEGIVDVVRERRTGIGSGNEGTEHLARLRPGDHFGEMGLLGEGRRTATCLAAGDAPVRAFAIGRAEFMQIVETSDLVSDEIAAVARRRFLMNKLREAIPRADRSRFPQLLQDAEVQTVEPDGVVIRQGEPADAFYIVLRGRVEVLTEDREGTRTPLATLGDGEFFGETGLLRGQPRNATVKAGGHEPVELLAIGRDAFLDLVEQSPSARRDIAAVMCQRVLEALNG